MQYYSLDERIIAEAHYFIESGGTIRTTAKKFDVSKSTVHKDLSEKLAFLNPALFAEVKTRLNINLSERHIRGGNATKQKYVLKSAAAKKMPLRKKT